MKIDCDNSYHDMIYINISNNDISLEINEENQDSGNYKEAIMNKEVSIEENNDICSFEINKNNDNLHEKTNYKTNIINNVFQRKNDSKKSNSPILITLNEIKEILHKSSETNDIINNLLFTDDTQKIESLLQLTGQKKERERPNDDIYNFLNETNDIKENKNNKKRGRKSNKFSYRGEHTKLDADNIIKSIKTQLFKYSLKFLNNMTDNKKEYELKPLDYKYTNRLKKEQDLSFLNMPLYLLFSKDITSKVQSKDRDHNKRTIEKILENEKDPNIQFAFHMTFEEWMDLFLFKRNITQIANNYIFDDYNCIIFEDLEKKIEKVNVMLNEKFENKKDPYFTHFIIYLYNYKTWFLIKKERTR